MRDSLERLLRPTLLVGALALLIVIPRVIDHKARVYAQDHEWAYNLITSFDAASFTQGGSLYPTNQVTWAYAHRLSQPRPWWHRVLFWGPNNKEPVDFPDYRYRPHFEHDFPPRLDG